MNRRLVFIAHEFDKRISNPLREHVGKVLTKNGYEPIYADNEYWRLILEKVKESVTDADFAIFDLASTRGHLNSNVVLELGFAIGLNKPVYIAVRSRDFSKFHRSLVDLHGITVVKYDTYADLAQKIGDFILPNHALVPAEIQRFWQPFIEKGCVVVFGVQNIILANGEIRAITGRYDNVAFSLLYSFLASMVRPFLLRGPHFEAAFMSMPIDKDNPAKMHTYRRHIEAELTKCDKNLIILGTPNVNPAAEVVMAHMTRSTPFQPSDKLSSRLGYVVNDYRRASCSTFFRGDRKRRMGIWRSLRDKKPIVEYSTNDRAGGFIIRTEYNGHDVLVFSGYNGTATVGGLRITMENSKEVAELNARLEKGHKHVLVPYETTYETVMVNNEPPDATIMKQELLLEHLRP